MDESAICTQLDEALLTDEEMGQYDERFKSVSCGTIKLYKV